MNEKQIESDVSISYELGKIEEKSQRNAVNKSSSREIYNEDYGFTINTDFVKKIEDAETGNHSYNFPIVRDTPATENLENLLLHSNVDGGYDAYIVQYDFTSKEYVNFNGNTVADFNTILTPIDFDTGVFNDGELSKMVYGCSESWEWVIVDDGDQGDLVGDDDAEQFTMGWAITGISCGYYDDGTGGGGDGSDTGSSSSGGGGTSGSQDPNYDPTDPDIHGNGSNNNGPVITAPAPTQNPHITELMALTDNLVVKAKIAELKTKLEENREYGYQFSLSSPNTFSEPVEGVLDPEDNQGIMFPEPTIFTRLEMHTHFLGGDSVFSAEDLFKAAKLAVNSNSDKATQILVAPNGKIYALKVSDSAKALAFANYNLQAGKAKMRRYYEQVVIFQADKKCAGTCSPEVFQDLMNNYLAYYLGEKQWDAGLILYEAIQDNNGVVTGWIPVTFIP